VDYLLENLISACLKAWGQDNTDKTPRITRWLENIFYPIIVNNLTLLESAPLITTDKDNTYKNIMLQNVNSDVILNDWQMYEKSPENQKQNILEGASNRLRKFLRNDIIRTLIGQKDIGLNIPEIMSENKILLINLNGGNKITHENSKLLGTMIVNEFFRVAKLRDPNDPNLSPFYFYIDEFANYVTRDIARSLEETRKFKMFMILAHQHLAQLKEEDEYLYASVMTNCKNKIVFGGLGIEDTKLMTEEIQTGFLDLKRIKHKMFRTRVTHHEETRDVITKSKTDSNSESHSSSTGMSSTQSESLGNSNSSSSGATRKNNDYDNENSTISDHTGLSNNSTNSWSDGYNSSETSAITQAHTNGKSISKVPFLRPEEVEELASVNFWSKDELMHMAMGELKNQETAEAFIKIGSDRPVQCQIKYVKPVYYSKVLSPKKIKKFKEEVVKAHPQYYLTTEQAKLSYQKRQTLIFGEPLKFDEAMVISKQEDIIYAEEDNILG